MTRDLRISEASALEILRDQGPLSDRAATEMGAGYLRELKLLKRRGMASVDADGTWEATALGLERMKAFRERNPLGG